MTRHDHWERIYATKAPAGLSWFQSEPTLSLRLLESAGLSPGS